MKGESHKEPTKLFQRNTYFYKLKIFPISTKKSAPKLLFFIEKKFRKIHFESPILSLCDKAAKQGKAFRDAYNRGGWSFL